MTSSIRTFLLINLLLSVTLITSLAIIGNLFLAHKDIQSQLDVQLIRTTMQMQALFSDGIKGRKLSVVQASIENALNPSNAFLQNQHALIRALKNYRFHTVFQIWGDEQHLLLHSHHAPKGRLSNGRPGLSNIWINGTNWRVFTSVDRKHHLTFMVAEQSNFRRSLENQLTSDSIVIMLLTYPFLGVLIWIIVGRALHILKKVTGAVKNRAANYLEPVDVSAVPTELEPLIEELNELFKRLSQAFDREKRFAADAAHELRTPLAALKTQVQVAVQSQEPAQLKASLKKVIIGVDRATHVVQQLLTLSRLLPGTSINAPETMDLNHAAAEMAAILAPEAVKKNIELEFISANMPAYITGNPTAIGIMIRNLLDNAIRYTPENGDVVIQVQAANETCVLTVSDTGPGIPAELRERVFERFYRVIGNKAQGSGLGLGIVQQISDAHNAELDLLSPDNHSGLVVKVTFKRVN